MYRSVEQLKAAGYSYVCSLLSLNDSMNDIYVNGNTFVLIEKGYMKRFTSIVKLVDHIMKNYEVSRADVEKFLKGVVYEEKGKRAVGRSRDQSHS